LFFNADDEPEIPLITMFAASNEMPQSDGMSALWDRLHFRHEIGAMVESSSFIRMLSSTMDPNPPTILDLDDVFAAHAAVDAVTLSEEIFEAMKDLRSDLRAEEVTVTERRWVESVGIIKSEAFYNGHEAAEISDMRPLMHVLWGDLDHQKIVRQKVLGIADPLDREAMELYDLLLQFERDFNEILEDADNDKSAAKQAVEVQQKLKKCSGQVKSLTASVEARGRKSEYVTKTRDKFVALTRRVFEEGFGHEFA
jgi:MoxR-like ATPase